MPGAVNDSTHTEFRHHRAGIPLSDQVCELSQYHYPSKYVEQRELRVFECLESCDRSLEIYHRNWRVQGLPSPLSRWYRPCILDRQIYDRQGTSKLNLAMVELYCWKAIIRMQVACSNSRDLEIGTQVYIHTLPPPMHLHMFESPDPCHRPGFCLFVGLASSHQDMWRVYHKAYL
jgi:hypothetical protein